MTVSDDAKTKVRAHVNAQLAAVTAAEHWPLPRLATDVDLDDDAYQAVRAYTDEAPEAEPPAPGSTAGGAPDPDSPPIIPGPVRRDLGVDPVFLHRVAHSTTLTGAEAHQIKVGPAPKGPDWAGSPRARLDRLVAAACRTQVTDLLVALLRAPQPQIEPSSALDTAITALPASGRVALVTIDPPDQATIAVIELHRDEGVIEYFALHQSLLALGQPPAAEVSMFLVHGTPPLAMRYVAHDLEVSVDDDGEGLVVTLEERSGWWAPPQTRLRRFKSSH